MLLGYKLKECPDYMDWNYPWITLVWTSPPRICPNKTSWLCIDFEIKSSTHRLWVFFIPQVTIPSSLLNMKFAGLLSLIFASTILATPLPRAEQGQLIHFNHSNKCLTVKNSVFANGTPVLLYDISNSKLCFWLKTCYRNDCAKAQRWVIQKGGTKVRVAGTSFCLDNGAGQWF